MIVTDHAGSARTGTADVHVCENCGRAMAALDKKEYTAARARLIIDRGLCVCPDQVPVRGPSLI